MKSVLDRIENIQFKDRVRTAAGARRYGQPIGSIIRRDRAGNILPSVSDIGDTRSPMQRQRDTAKKPNGNSQSRTPDKSIRGTWQLFEEPDEDGYEVITNSRRKKFYIAQDDEGWGAWDANDNLVAEGSNRSELLKELDNATSPPQPPGMHQATDADRKRLVVPPDWRGVFVADDKSAPMQARGSDKAGRFQYIYTSEHRGSSDAKKFEKMKKLHKQMPKLDKALKEHMGDDTWDCLMMMRVLGMRPDTGKEGGEVETYGATTLQAKMVSVTPGGQVNLNFTPGKKKNAVTIKIKDQMLAEMLRERLKTRKRNDPMFETTAVKTQAALKSVVPTATNKDLRTLKANAIALAAIKKKKGMPGSKSEFRRWRREVATQVSDILGNTPTIALGSYIDPSVFSNWMSDPSWN